MGLGLDAGERFEVYVSHIESPGRFWIQRADAEKTLEELTESLEVCADKPEIDREEVCVGEMFASK